MLRISLLLALGTITSLAHAAPLPSVTAERQDIAQRVRFDGLVEAIDRSTVSAQTSGRVMVLPFDVGDQVPVGAEIVRLTSTEQGARVDAARSTLAEAKARMAEAETAYRRAREIIERKLISQAEFDQVVANHKAAKARVAAAEAQLSQAQETLKYTAIKAPYGGIVEARHVEIGETVAPGTPLMTGISLDRLRVLVDVPQQYITSLREHRQASVVLPDGRVIEPAKVEIPPAADPATHSFRIRLDLPQGQHQLFPGTLVKASFVNGVASRLTIPASTIIHRGELTAVYVLKPDDRVELRYLRIAEPNEDGRVPIEAGLDAGERIAVDPLAAARLYRQGLTDAP